MKKHDGYCVKDPGGSLWPAYFSPDRRQVEQDMRENIAASDGHDSLARLKREGYSVVPVRIGSVIEV